MTQLILSSRHTRRRFKEIKEDTQSARSIFHPDDRASSSVLSDDAESHFERALFRSKVYQRVPALQSQADAVVIESYEEIPSQLETRAFLPGKTPLTTQDILDLQERCRHWIEMKMNLAWMDENRAGAASKTAQQAEAVLAGIVADVEAWLEGDDERRAAVLLSTTAHGHASTNINTQANNNNKLLLLDPETERAELEWICSFLRYQLDGRLPEMSSEDVTEDVTDDAVDDAVDDAADNPPQDDVVYNTAHGVTHDVTGMSINKETGSGQDRKRGVSPSPANKKAMEALGNRFSKLVGVFGKRGKSRDSLSS